jgi:hypothetical protein
LFWVTLASVQDVLLGRRANWNKVKRIGIKRQRDASVIVQRQVGVPT